VLFTAFEPSGDALAAPVIEALLQRAPGLQVYACGGAKMEEAGARMIEHTADDAAMALGALRRVRAVRRHLGQLRRWSRGQRVIAHIPVDSPAANFPVCRELRRQGARVIHLVAPQLWAWGPWRIGKLRRRTDLVLCVLPFEEPWFTRRNVPARFIGHPAVNRALDQDDLQRQAAELPQGAPRVALFPGSRSHEVAANLRLLTDTYAELQARHSGLCGLIVAATPQLAEQVRRRLPVFATGLHMMTGRADVAIAWCDLALAVSGTVTLHIARQARPMIGVYRTGAIPSLLSRFLLRTPYRLLPNILAGRPIVPEYVPYAGGPGPIVRDAHRYLSDSREAARQREALRIVLQSFAGHDPAGEAAEQILGVIGKESSRD
jgi:lipid-A-disaccharide synthase